MNFELQRLKKTMDNAIDQLNKRIDNISLESILDKHINNFENQINSITTKLDEQKELLESYKNNKNTIENKKTKNKELQDQINTIKQKMVTIDIKDIAYTQRYIDSVKSEIEFINEEKDLEINKNIDELEQKIQYNENELNKIVEKATKFKNAKQVLGL